MQRKLIATTASLLIIVSVVSIWLTLRPSSGSFEARPSVGVGEILAEKTARAIQDKGKIVAVVAEAYRIRGSESQVQWEAFQVELKKHTGISLVTTEVVQPGQGDGMPGCPVTVFKDLLVKHANVDAIVFFMSLPDWRWLQNRGSIPEQLIPKIFVRDDASVSPKNHYGGYFARGLLAMLVMRRLEANPQQISKPTTTREWFENEYQIFTSQNYEALPE